MRKFARVATVTTAALLGPSTPSLADFLSVCEAEIAKRLLAPATYRQHSATKMELTISEAEYIERYLEHRMHPQDSESMISALRLIARALANDITNSGDGLTLFVYDITYDASNAYGVPIRATARCEALPRDGKESSIGPRDVRLR